MNKLFSIFAAVVLAGTAQLAIAQNAHEGRVKFMKGEQNAIIADYQLPKKVVEDALKTRLEKAGLGKKGSEKGFNAYKGTTWTEISNDKVDVYTKVEGKSNQATVTILVSKGYDNFITTATDAEKVQQVEAFLNGFVNDINAYQLNLNIAAQMEVIKKAEKVVKKSSDGGSKLAAEKDKIEKKMADNKSEQDKKQAMLEEEKKKLEDMKAQVKS